MHVLLSAQIVDLIYFPAFTDPPIPHQERPKQVFILLYTKESKTLRFSGNIIFSHKAKISDGGTGSFYSFKNICQAPPRSWDLSRGCGCSRGQDRQGPAGTFQEQGQGRSKQKVQ